MNELTKKQIEMNRQKYQSMVGQNVYCIVTGMAVEGQVTVFTEDEHSFTLSVDHQPVRWGNETYNSGSFFARKCDDWGSANNIRIRGEHEDLYGHCDNCGELVQNEYIEDGVCVSCRINII